MLSGIVTVTTVPPLSQRAMPVYIDGSLVINAERDAEEGLEEVRRARERGVKVYAETCPQYLLLDDAVYRGSFDEAAKFICSPPIRGVEDADGDVDAQSHQAPDQTLRHAAGHALDELQQTEGCEILAD